MCEMRETVRLRNRCVFWVEGKASFAAMVSLNSLLSVICGFCLFFATHVHWVCSCILDLLMRVEVEGQCCFLLLVRLCAVLLFCT